MGNDIKLQKYRKLSVAALVTGILAIGFGFLYNFLWMPIANLLQSSVDVSIIPYIVLPGVGIAFGLAISAVVCGSIDLERIKAGINSRKGKGFDITGIVLGGLFILIVIWFLLGELLVPH
jgi:hypothetical protein